MEKEFWEQRWQAGETGWDIGSVSPPLKEYIDQIEDKSAKILIPGCGNAYEAEYLWNNGFKNTFIVEISKTAVDSFLERCPQFPRKNIFNQDFFDLDENDFDYVIEQTFFCAIDPKRRDDYVIKMSELLKPGGKLFGVMFQFPLVDGPPFGGDSKEYKKRFKNEFEICIMENCKNSIDPRKGRELFVEMMKKI